MSRETLTAVVGFGELVFGGDPKVMITNELGLPTGTIRTEIAGQRLIMQRLDIAAAVIAVIMVTGLAVFFHGTRIGRALRAAGSKVIYFAGYKHLVDRYRVDDIEAAMPRLARSTLTDGPAAGDTPQLVSIAPGHLVEAIVTH